MFYLKSINFENFCGYKKIVLSFFKDNKPLPLSVFFGPNGTGKSTILSGIRIISNPYQFYGRENDLYFRKMTFHEDYDPTYAGFMKSSREMMLEGTFVDVEMKEYKVIIDKNGIIDSQLPRYNSDQEGWSIFTDADHPINMNKFQLKEEAKDKFLEIASYVYGLPLELGKPIETHDFNETARFYQDLIIVKNEVRVHFKRMSDGERKIATLLRTICNESVMNPSKICLIDNAEMHIYFKRHPGLVRRLISIFPDMQFITTSHSSTFIQAAKSQVGENSLFDLEKFHGYDMVKYDSTTEPERFCAETRSVEG
jgi:predicted ATP-binding protein involved in virulence